MKKTLTHVLITVIMLCNFITSYSQAPDFGAASSFVLFTSAGAFNNAGTSMVTGDIGTNVGAFNGFPPGIVVGAIHVADPVTAQAAPAVDLAYAYLSGLTCGQVIGTTLGNNQLLGPDIYCLGAASSLNGSLVLDGQGDPNAIFIFQINGALSTNVLSQVVLINSASICNVYWQINGAVELGDFSVFRGQIVANGAISLLQSASLFGRALSRAGAISLANNVVTLDLAPEPSVITTTSNLTFCEGSSIVLSGNVGGVWSTGETTPSITVTESGDYFVTTTNSCGQIISNHIIVNVIPLPTVNDLPDITVNCELVPAITLTGNPPGVVLTWTRTPEPIGANLNGIQIIPAFIPTNTTGAPLTSTFTVTPSITVNGVTCPGLPITFTITVLDNVPPVFLSCPGTINLSCNDPIPAPVAPTAIDICDLSVSIAFTQTSTRTTNGTCTDNSYVITRTWIASDNFNNTAVCIQMINVQDLTAPIIESCPGPVTVSCSGLIPPPNILSVLAFDNCIGTPVVSFLGDVVTNQTCQNTYTVIRTYQASDLCGNTALCIQNIFVQDLIAPTLLTCPGPISVSCVGSIPAPNILLVIATDNCGLVPVVSFLSDVVTNQTCTNSYVLVRTYLVSDACGNTTSCVQNITVSNLTPPTINCPANIQVSCYNQVPQPDINSVSANSDCGGGVTISFLNDISNNQTCLNRMIITRTYLATDLCQNTSSCSQIITVNDQTAPVLEPIETLIVIECDQQIPALPQMVALADCNGLPSVSFLETSTQSKWLQLCAHYTYTITRLWVATDDCGNSSTTIQQIRVQDTTPPIVSMIPDTAVYVTCDEGAVKACPMGVDVCDLTPSLLFDFYYTPIVGACASSYKVVRKWTSGDKCGNVSIITQNVYVIDNAPPELTCPANIILVSAVPIAVTWMMPKAWDDCDGMLVAVQTKGPKNGSLFDPGTTTTIQFETTDYCGNVNTCSFTVTINTVKVVAPGQKISGLLTNMNGEAITNTEVSIAGSINQFKLANGNFEFSGITKGNDENISVSKIDNPLDGVSTLDLIHITNHILGKKALTSPYKYLAGDVNNSGSITTSDLVELRRLLLHITDKFTLVDSWKFLPALTSFENLKNPWLKPIAWTVDLKNIQNDINADFYGIKMGDVTWDAKGNATNKIEVKSNDKYILSTENFNYAKGDDVNVLIKGKDLNAFQGLQFTLEYDVTSLEFSKIQSQQKDISEKNFGLRFLESGKISGSIVFSNAIEDENLISVRFTALKSGSINKNFKLNSTLLNAEAYTLSDEVKSLQLEFKDNNKQVLESKAVLYQNEPNPFDNNTKIRFFIAEDQEVSISIFTLEGKLIKELKEIYSKGDNSLNLTKSDLTGAGTYYYQLKTLDGIETKKMIFVW